MFVIIAISALCTVIPYRNYVCTQFIIASNIFADSPENSHFIITKTLQIFPVLHHTM